MTSAAELQAKTDKFVINMDRLNLLVNGPPGTMVTTDNGVVPSIPGVIDQFRRDAEAILAGIAPPIPEV